MKKILLGVTVLLIVIAVFFLTKKNEHPEPLSFEECVAQGYPVMESYPRQCNFQGKNFTENIGNANEKSDLIVLDSPKPNSVLSGNKITFVGKARGYWFFEASFPIDILDGNGKVIGQGHAEAQEEWMTENFIPFKGEVILKETPQTATGVLVLRKDNPSGDAIRDDSLEVPVSFARN